LSIATESQSVDHSMFRLKIRLPICLGLGENDRVEIRIQDLKKY